jgi:leader peptidase (prepilin peptidase)/N-methyltransferase
MEWVSVVQALGVPSEQLLTMRVFVYVFAFLMGATWGSFLNVVIYRLPRGLSLVRPASRCPGCETPIKARDNVPILGWLWLRGKCRACGMKISARYPLIELLMGLLSLGLAVKVFHGRLAFEHVAVLAVPYAFLFVFLAALVALFFIDLDVTELPPEITIPGIGVGVLGAWLTDKAGALATFAPNVTVGDSLLGAVIGGGVILLLFVGYLLLTGRVGLGGGDLWMMAMVGAFLGWECLLFVYLASSVQGILAAVVMSVVQRGKPDSALFRNREVDALEAELKTSSGASDPLASSDNTPVSSEDPEARSFGKLAIPFGPFIALSAAEYVFVGEWVLPWLTGHVVGPNGFLM